MSILSRCRIYCGYVLGSILVFAVQSCAKSPELNVDLLNASNVQGNSIVTIASNPELYKGLFFEFIELKTCPANMQDEAGTNSIYQPDPNGPGSSAASSTFTLDTDGLDPNKPYALHVFALQISQSGGQAISQISHEGLADCPLYLGNTANPTNIKVCFGPVGTNPTCLGTTDFDMCTFPSNIPCGL